MNSKSLIAKVSFTLALIFSFGGLATSQKAEAAYRYPVSTTNITKTPYHRKSAAGAVYNLNHTRKLANLKSYPYTTWYATQRVILKHGNTKGTYYKVTNGSKTVTGYVWHKYLTPGKSEFGLKYALSATAFNTKTNQVVWSKNGNTARPIASVSKLMTLYLVREKVANGASWDDSVNTSYWGLKSMGNSAVFGGFRFTKNSYTVRQLYLAALVESSNNAAIALGQWVAGGSTPSANREFTKLMNQQADEWGLDSATFVSASGMEQNSLQTYGYSVPGANANFVSANDVARMAANFIKDYPDLTQDAQIKSINVAGQNLYNYNNLLPGRKYYQANLKVDGLKTGFTNPAGYCFVGTGQKDGHDRIVTVVLHDENEFTETRSLMNHVYNNGLA